MGPGPHPHPHDHDHEQHDHPNGTPAPVDMSIPDAELSPNDLSRRRFLRGAGVLGAAGAAAAAAAAFAAPGVAAANGDDDHGPLGRSWAGHSRRNGYLWLAGDHHIHTQYSSDAQYRVIDHVQHANAYGLDWMVITDHGSVAHAKIGVDKVNPDIVAARGEIDDTLVFQGLEWNIPGAEHGTVFVHPGPNEVAVLKEFENTYDGVVVNATASNPANEALAVAGVHFLADAVSQKRVKDALFLANHPARKGIDSPHEIRAWRDADPRIAVGMEGAPGHQAAGLVNGAASARGFYDFSPSADSFPGYPAESYRTWGGFDWMTATVGGLWDSLLAEGKAWWITANSDSHQVYADIAVRPTPTGDFNANGKYDDPVYSGGALATTNGDFWPGFYSRTHVGASDFSYAAVMAGLRAGRVWVDHGRLIDSIDVKVRTGGSWVTLGDTLVARRGSSVQLVVSIDLAGTSNWAQFIPVLSRVDVIRGAVTGAVADRDSFTTAGTKVVQSFEVTKKSGQVTFTYDLGRLDDGFYVRLRGTDGKRTAPGLLGAAVDPVGPAMDLPGNGDPWTDLWFYTNPIWVLPHT